MGNAQLNGPRFPPKTRRQDPPATTRPRSHVTSQNETLSEQEQEQGMVVSVAQSAKPSESEAAAARKWANYTALFLLSVSGSLNAHATSHDQTDPNDKAVG